MRIAQLTPGTGHFYCGNCLREATLARALRAEGHEATIVPLYLPIFTEDAGSDDRIAMGGINVYLRHRMPWLPIPRAVGRLMDDARLLRWASRRGDMTDASSHAALAVAMLEGEIPVEGRRLVDQIREMKPDVICLCNLLLLGLVRELRTLDVPILVSMHGEHGYLDEMPQPSRDRAWQAVRTGLELVDGAIAVSDFYRRFMADRLGIDPGRIHVVHNGIDLDDIMEHEASEARTIGYLARMCDDKGLHVLVEACLELARRDVADRLELLAVGVQLDVDRAYVRSLEGRLRDAGITANMHANVTRAEKLALLRRMRVLSVPATYGEAFGLYVIEALAHGVPYVQPDHGAFPELHERTGGGMLVKPDDPIALADGLEAMLRDPEQADRLGAAGRAVVHEHFTSARMAREFLEVCAMAGGGDGT